MISAAPRQSPAYSLTQAQRALLACLSTTSAFIPITQAELRAVAVLVEKGLARRDRWGVWGVER